MQTTSLGLNRVWLFTSCLLPSHPNIFKSMDGRYHHSVLFINKVNASQKADIFDDKWGIHNRKVQWTLNTEVAPHGQYQLLIDTPTGNTPNVDLPNVDLTNINLLYQWTNTLSLGYMQKINTLFNYVHLLSKVSKHYLLPMT